MCYYGIVEILKEHHNQQLINTLSGRNSKGFLFVLFERGSYMYHAGLGKFVNDNYIKKITTKNKINKNIIFGYVKDNIYYELNEIVEDIDAYINKLETEGCVVYFVKKKKISRRNSNTGQQRE